MSALLANTMATSMLTVAAEQSPAARSLRHPARKPQPLFHGGFRRRGGLRPLFGV